MPPKGQDIASYHSARSRKSKLERAKSEKLRNDVKSLYQPGTCAAVSGVAASKVPPPRFYPGYTALISRREIGRFVGCVERLGSDFGQDSDISHTHGVVPPSALSDKDDPFQVARRFSHEVATADNVLTSV
ncbi:MAG: hypothetical protein EZS28_014057, partial [Streblomastix strix]